MKIKHTPSGRNAYWFESAGEHEILHLGCFAETLEKSLEVYADLLGRLYVDNPSLWMEFQSYKAWWFDERRRDYKLQWKAPAYEDQAHLAYRLIGQDEIVTAFKTFWLIKELRFYFWKQNGVPLEPQDIVAAVARNEFEELARYVPSAMRFVAARQICSSYLRVMFHRTEAKFVNQLLLDAAAKSGLNLLLEACVFKTGRS